MGQEFKLPVSILFVLLSLSGYAQRISVKDFFLMPGITVSPFFLTKNYTTATSYSLQFGGYGFPVKGVVRFGFPSYNKMREGTHSANYNITGSYIEPGLIIYSTDPSKENSVFYVGLLGYFGRYDHTLTLEIEDSWGVHKLDYSAETKVKGLLFELGGLFTFYEGLKGTISIDIGGVKRPDNPIPQIPNFYNVANMPGIGHGTSNLLYGVNLGLHYQIF